MKEFDFLQFNNSETKARIVWKDQSVTEFLPVRTDKSVVYEDKIYLDGEGYVPDEEYLSVSWISGVYKFEDMEVTINTGLSFVSIESSDNSQALQGDEADEFIKGVHHIYCIDEYSNVHEAIKKYLNQCGY